MRVKAIILLLITNIITIYFLVTGQNDWYYHLVYEGKTSDWEMNVPVYYYSGSDGGGGEGILKYNGPLNKAPINFDVTFFDEKGGEELTGWSKHTIQERQFEWEYVGDNHDRYFTRKPNLEEVSKIYVILQWKTKDGENYIDEFYLYDKFAVNVQNSKGLN